jgi:hypothetical protein
LAAQVDHIGVIHVEPLDRSWRIESEHTAIHAAAYLEHGRIRVIRQIAVREQIKGRGARGDNGTSDLLPHAPRAHSLEGLAHVVVDMPHRFFCPRVTQDGVFPLALNRPAAQGHEHRFFFFGEVNLLGCHWLLLSVNCARASRHVPGAQMSAFSLVLLCHGRPPVPRLKQAGLICSSGGSPETRSNSSR